MVRTQIYLTQNERDGLKSLAAARGKKQSELIRVAVDHLLEQAGEVRRKSALDRAAGIWKNRRDLPDFQKLRAEWDKG
jgi:hypothetical protein